MHELQAARVCGSVTSIPARIILAGTRAGTCAQSPVHATGLQARGPGPRLWFQAARSALGRLQPSCSCSCAPCGRAAERCAGRAQPRTLALAAWGRFPGPPGSARALAELNTSWRLARLVRLLRSAASGPPAGGDWPEADFLKCRSGPPGGQVAEESGSRRVWARPREECHLTILQWRTRHTGATPHLASRNKPASPRRLRLPVSKVSRR